VGADLPGRLEVLFCYSGLAVPGPQLVFAPSSAYYPFGMRPAKARRLLVAASLIGASACLTPAAKTTSAAPTPTAAPRPVPNDVRWFRNSAEYRALASEVYSSAGQQLPVLSRGLAASTWAVILDADETVLDNSEYQQRRAMLDSGYTEESWAGWVRERAAVAVPGAVDYTRFVHALGGKVVIVTNRALNLCDATRENLSAIGVDVDMLLCQPQGESNKNPRFQRVQTGMAENGVAALKVVEWVGDNIQDFPDLTQAARNDPKALAEFGRRFFMLPNPMYGSWQQVP
jgi:5'-nucleotidase (lipoprotein e(P4) family)